jgi:glycosyltransferase involved in cell wall biosynthesis
MSRSTRPTDPGSGVVAVVSFRLGGTDGVSVEAAKWDRAWRALGFHVVRVAGEIHGPPARGDRVLPWLAIDPPMGAAPDATELRAGLQHADVVIVENLCSLPMNLEASRTTARVLAARGGPVVLHHHDLPWQREQYAAVTDLPPRSAGALHVTINRRSRDELVGRGYDAARVLHIPNCFDTEASPGDRDGTRRRLGFAPHDVVVLQPTRAIARKNIPGALEFVTRLATELHGRPVRYWLTGPAEDGFDDALDSLVAGAHVPVTLGRVDHPADAYAAADLVICPSTWEGFGNPLVEAAVARRPVVAGPFPVRTELEELGLRFLTLDAPDEAACWVHRPDTAWLDANLAAVRRHLDVRWLPERLAGVLDRAGVELRAVSPAT